MRRSRHRAFVVVLLASAEVRVGVVSRALLEVNVFFLGVVQEERTLWLF